MIRTLRHRGLKRLHERGDLSKLRADQMERIGIALADLNAAKTPQDLDLPGYRLHPLKGDLRASGASGFPPTGASSSALRTVRHARLT